MNGKPPNQNYREHQRQPRYFQNDTRAYQTNVERAEQKPGENIGGINLNKEQLERLYKLLSPDKITGTSLVAQQVNFFSPSTLTAHEGYLHLALSCAQEKLRSWIIDSGASDHMTGCAQLFSSYIPNNGNTKVRIADGSLSPIAGIGTVKINSTLVLKSVLHVPNLSCNLLSISKISEDCNCRVIFSQNCCEFQDLSSGKRIGNASEHEGLYYFDMSNDENKQVHNVSWEPS